VDEGRRTVSAAFAASAEAAASRKTSCKIHDPAVQARLAAVTPEMSRRLALRRASAAAARAPGATGVPNHDHRFLAADGGSPQGACGACEWLSSEADYTAYLRGETGAAVRWQEGDQSRRARPRRVRAQRHGAVFRRAARRLRVYQTWLGAEPRLTLCPPADHFRRRLPAEADDGRVVELCAISDREAHEGYADRARASPGPARIAPPHTSPIRALPISTEPI